MKDVGGYAYISLLIVVSAAAHIGTAALFYPLLASLSFAPGSMRMSLTPTSNWIILAIIAASAVSFFLHVKVGNNPVSMIVRRIILIVSVPLFVLFAFRGVFMNSPDLKLAFAVLAVNFTTIMVMMGGEH